MKIVGIETSCDETAAAVVKFDGKSKLVLLSNEVSSSVDLHAVYGGVVPEIAARSHLEYINPVVEQALKDAACDWDSIDAIAVTQGPGLGGSLMIGVLTARTLAIVHNKPLFAVNHVEAHAYAAFFKSNPHFPLLSLVVSGGHSHLVLFESHFKYRVLGRTLDDAVGEAFDKVAKILGLPYPGGPSVERAAVLGDAGRYELPVAKLDTPYNFSFSGLKTATLRAAQKAVGKDFTFPSHMVAELLSAQQRNDIAAGFQKAAFDQLLVTLKRAIDKFEPQSVVVAGGVASSSALRDLIEKQLKIDVLYPDPELCTDNGAMVAANGAFQLASGQEPVDPYTLEFLPDLKM